jgi:hypothetical protein
VLVAFELQVNFVRALGDQEQPADDENQVAPGDVVPEEPKERRREAHHPGDRQQQQNPDEHRQEHAQLAGTLALFARQFAGEDRHEDDVVDAEDDLEHAEGEERDPAVDARRPAEGRLPGHAVRSGASPSAPQVSGSCHRRVLR